MSYEYRPNGFGGLPVVVKNLLIINVLVYVISLFLLSQAPRIFELLIVHYFQSDDFRPHQLVTAMFMHSPNGFGHIFGNMFGLWIFGSMLERVWGAKRFLIFYIVCGLGANICDQIYLYFKFTPVINELMLAMEKAGNYVEAEQYNQLIQSVKDSYASLGASGAIYGLIMGAAMLFPNTQLYLYFMIPIKMKWLAIIYGAIELYAVINTVPGDNVAHLVHLGGMLFGFVLIKIWSRDKRHFY
jgi:membrane associated rhomboid family serine protease